MFMAKQPVSVTLEADNLLWLRTQTARAGRRSVSETLDALITAARAAGTGEQRSVVGTVDIAADDPMLEHADALVQELVTASLSRPWIARDASPSGSQYRPGGRKRG